MYTLIDYIKYYKDKDIDEIKWNIMDNLICAILVYLKITPFKDCKYVSDLEVLPYAEGMMAPSSLEVFNLIKGSRRYNDLKVSNFQLIKDEHTQFGAVTFEIGGLKIVSFKGTDGSLIGWIENIRIGYEYPTYTQMLAINYLKNVRGKNIYVVGHSKGGNLALVSSMENFDKVKWVYNFDGPGLLGEQFKSDKFRKISSKLTNVVPTGSVVGTILHNSEYMVVKSSNLAFDEHYPTSWNIFGQFFVEDRLSRVSQKLHLSSSSGIDSLDPIKTKETFETIFASLGKDYTGPFNMNFNDFINFYKNMKNIDPNVRKYLDTITSSLMAALYKTN